MAASPQKNANVRLLACLVDEEDTGDGDYRFLVDGQHVKYVTTAPGAFRGHEDDRTFGPILIHELLPVFPPSDWNKGHIARDEATGEPAFLRTETVRFSGVKNRWHPVTFNEHDFTRKDHVRQRVHVVTHPNIHGGRRPVLMKLAVWPWEIPSLEIETAAYQWFHESGSGAGGVGRGVGPTFLGHLTEGKNGRVVGFVTEWVEGTRAAGLADLDGCKRALGQLHALGIKMGDINKHNFLVRNREGHNDGGDGDGDVVLVDFETVRRDCSPAELADEMGALEANLASTSFRGGVERITCPEPSQEPETEK